MAPAAIHHILVNPIFIEVYQRLLEPFFADGNEASSHDLVLILSREDSFIDRGIKETLESAHVGQT